MPRRARKSASPPTAPPESPAATSNQRPSARPGVNISTSRTADGRNAQPEPPQHVRVFRIDFVHRFAALKLTGSSAMPHFGHEPGPICRTSGCIGHVYSTAAGAPSGCMRHRHRFRLGRRMQVLLRIRLELGNAALGAEVVSFPLVSAICPPPSAGSTVIPQTGSRAWTALFRMGNIANQGSRTGTLS